MANPYSFGTLTSFLRFLTRHAGSSWLHHPPHQRMHQDAPCRAPRIVTTASFHFELKQYVEPIAIPYSFGSLTPFLCLDQKTGTISYQRLARTTGPAKSRDHVRSWSSSIAANSQMQRARHIHSRGRGERRSEERRVGKECRSRWSPYH